MIQEFTSLMCVPVDGQTLTTVMHHRGINMRYLGYIALLCSNWTFIQVNNFLIKFFLKINFRIYVLEK